MTSSVGQARAVGTMHTACVAAPPRVVYDLIADTSRWPFIFPSSVYVERLISGATEERLRLWTVANGAVRSWISRRVLDADNLRIRCRHEAPSPPVAAMAGDWVFIPLPGDVTSVVRLHEFHVMDNDPGKTALIKQALDQISTTELAALKATAELGDQLSMLLYSFADSVVIQAEPASVYNYLYRIEEWPKRLPHVSRVILDEAVPNVQTVEMDAHNSDGSVCTTRAVRICFPHHAIAYKQTQPLETMSAHLGAWHLSPVAEGVVKVTCRHTVMIRPERIGKVADQNGTVEQVRDRIRRALGNNCLATLMHLKNAVEGRMDL